MEKAAYKEKFRLFRIKCSPVTLKQYPKQFGFLTDLKTIVNSNIFIGHLSGRKHFARSGMIMKKLGTMLEKLKHLYSADLREKASILLKSYANYK